MKKIIAALVLFPFAAWAQMVPAIDKTAAVVPTSSSVELNPKELRALAIAKEWKDNPDKPRRSADGVVKYLYGATLPTMICTPFQVCAIQLERGEVVNDMHAGDTARWSIKPSIIGKDENGITVVIVKPTEPGLKTNLTITTDRRIYIIKLVSANHEWVPILAFDYPDDVDRAWSDYRARQGKATNAATLKGGVNVSSLDFNFRMSGDAPWKPIRVYSDGEKTYIEFPDGNFPEGMPALVELADDAGVFKDESSQLVNYRAIGNKFVADKRLRRFALVLGIDKNEKKVVIDYSGGAK